MTAHIKLILLSFVLSALAMSGCKWDDDLYERYVEERGYVEYCPHEKGSDGKLLYVEVIDSSSNSNESNSDNNESTDVKKSNRTIRCTKDCNDEKLKNIENCVELTDEKCKEARSDFEYKICPGSTVCKQQSDDSNNNYYCAFETNVCNTHDDCEPGQGWLKWECVKNKCVPSECDPATTHKHTTENDDTICAINTDKACGENRSDCSEKISESKKLFCDEGTCKVSLCNDGFHPSLDQTKCEKDDINNCNAINCTIYGGWDDGVCENNKCKATKCKQGYHPYNTLKVDDIGEIKYQPCDKDSDMACGQNKVDCTNYDNKLIIPGSFYECKNGTCEVKGCDTNKHYHQIQDPDNIGKLKCELDNVNACGAVGFDCTSLAGVEDKGPTNLTCISPAICHIEKCALGYHKTGKDGLFLCEADTNSHCGDNESCQAPTPYCTHDSTHAYCSSGCGDDIHTNIKQCDNQCVDITNNNDHCGNCNEKCSIANATTQCRDKTCSIINCDIGYHQLDNSCIPDDNNSCGRHGKCNIPNAKEINCINGECIAASCNQDFLLYEGTCIKIDNNNCGSVTNDCEQNLSAHDHILSISCEKDKSSSSYFCKYKCDNKYTYNDQERKCECNCIEHGICDINSCTLISCKTGYYKNDAQCMQVTKNNCGSKSYKCDNNEICKLTKNSTYCAHVDNQYLKYYTQINDTGAYYINDCNAGKSHNYWYEYYYNDYNCKLDNGDFGYCKDGECTSY